MWNIIFGIVCIIGGLSGKLALRGTDSGQALAVVGGALLVWGIVQVVKSRQGQSPAESDGNDADR
jgi:uncharacterized membrane protein (UPF0136 family)